MAYYKLLFFSPAKTSYAGSEKISLNWRMRAEATARPFLSQRSEKNLRKRRYKKVFKKKSDEESP